MTRPELWPRSTDRLVLRPPTEADLDAVLSWRNHPDVTRWLLTTQVDPERYRREWLSGADDPLDHSVVAVNGDVVVGTASLEVRHGMGQGSQSPASGSEGSLGYVRDSWHADLGGIDGYTYGVLADERR